MTCWRWGREACEWAPPGLSFPERPQKTAGGLARPGGLGGPAGSQIHRRDGQLPTALAGEMMSVRQDWA